MSYSIIDDCACGYATHSTRTCKQTDCSRYKARELKCAEREMKAKIEAAMINHTARIKKAMEN